MYSQQKKSSLKNPGTSLTISAFWLPPLADRVSNQCSYMCSGWLLLHSGSNLYYKQNQIVFQKVSKMAFEQDSESQLPVCFTIYPFEREGKRSQVWHVCSYSHGKKRRPRIYQIPLNSLRKYCFLFEGEGCTLTKAQVLLPDIMLLTKLSPRPLPQPLVSPSATLVPSSTVPQSSTRPPLHHQHQ